jgi:iron(III) transport system ATP-binding protein
MFRSAGQSAPEALHNERGRTPEQGSPDGTGRAPLAAGVELTGLSKSFGTARPAVDNISLQVQAGTFVSLLGPSGCGKTTTLRMIAGLETPTAGEISILGQTVYSHDRGADVAPDRRPIGFVFQSYALWPHMTVLENLRYPLTRAKVDKRAALEQVRVTLDLLQCGQLIDRYPGELSGGQQQRIALGRAIVNSKNQVVLFDEPLSNLDAKLRDELRYELRSLQETLRFTAIYVTHDQAEAMSMSDHLVVMRDGRIEAQGTPAEVFHQPTSVYVADFFGAHIIVPFTGLDDRPGHATVATTALGPVPVQQTTSAPASAQALAIPVEGLDLTAHPPAGEHFSAIALGSSYYGNHSDVRLALDGGPEIRCRVQGHQDLSRGQRVYGRVTCTAVLVRS